MSERRGRCQRPVYEGQDADMHIIFHRYRKEISKDYPRSYVALIGGPHREIVVRKKLGNLMRVLNREYGGWENIVIVYTGKV